MKIFRIKHHGLDVVQVFRDGAGLLDRRRRIFGRSASETAVTAETSAGSVHAAAPGLGKSEIYGLTGAAEGEAHQKASGSAASEIAMEQRAAGLGRRVAFGRSASSIRTSDTGSGTSHVRRTGASVSSYSMGQGLSVGTNKEIVSGGSTSIAEQAVPESAAITFAWYAPIYDTETGDLYIRQVQTAVQTDNVLEVT